MRKPAYTYVKRWRENLRKKLGEAGFLEWQRAEYRKYRERILANQKARLAKRDPVVAGEKRKEYWQQYKEKHGERIKADRRDYYARTRERTLARKKRNRDANPEATKLTWCKQSHLRRARKRKTRIGSLKAIAKVVERAKWWRQWFPVEIDHIISLARGGTHEAKNLQIIYDFENRRKHARLDYKPRVVFV